MTSSRARRHKAEQAKLARLLAGEVRQAVAPQPNPGSLRGLTAALIALAAQYQRASASLGASFFEEERRAAGFRDRFTLRLEPPNTQQLGSSLGWATRDLADDPIDLDAVLNRVEHTATRLALEGGRATVERAAGNDRQCVGYVRDAMPNCCWFCAMLATRGVDEDTGVGIYRSKRTARYKHGTSDPYHDSCRCMPLPIFRGRPYVPDEHVRRWQQQYLEVTADKSGKAKFYAFRDAFAG